MVLLHENKPQNNINRGGDTAERTNHCIILDLLTIVHEKLAMPAARLHVSRVSHNVFKKLKKTGLNKSIAYLQYFWLLLYLVVLSRQAFRPVENLKHFIT